MQARCCAGCSILGRESRRFQATLCLCEWWRVGDHAPVMHWNARHERLFSLHSNAVHALHETRAEMRRQSKENVRFAALTSLRRAANIVPFD
jgi:hypothetical protein